MKYNTIIGIVCKVLLTFFAFGLVFCLVYPIFSATSSKEQCTNTENCNTLHWNKSESKYMGSVVQGDSVQIRYLLVFENHDDVDYECSQLSAKLSFAELAGWIEYEKFFSGICENGSSTFLVPGGEKVALVFMFSGKYIGGKTPDDLSIPISIMFIQK